MPRIIIILILLACNSCAIKKKITLRNTNGLSFENFIASKFGSYKILYLDSNYLVLEKNKLIRIFNQEVKNEKIILNNEINTNYLFLDSITKLKLQKSDVLIQKIFTRNDDNRELIYKCVYTDKQRENKLSGAWTELYIYQKNRVEKIELLR
jgi:hypothetical protein